jgi:maleylpyruvate isomerase
MARLTLFNRWRSSASHRVRIALALKGLDYEYVPVVAGNTTQSGVEYRERSPTGYVPALEADGVTYVESVAIVEWLEDRFPVPPLFPRDAHGRARVRALVEMVNSGIQPLQNSSVVAHLAQMVGTAQSASASSDWLKHFIARGFGAIERTLENNVREGVDGPYAYGASPTAADVFLVPQVTTAKLFEVDLRPYTRVRACVEAAMRLEAFQKAAPENQIDVDVGADAVKIAR